MHSRDEDYALVERIKSGDREAFREIYTKYQRMLVNFVWRLVNNHDTAEEVAQKAFISAYMNIDKFREVSTFKSWLYAIAKNIAKNELRAQARRRSISLQSNITENGSLKLEDVIKNDVQDARSMLEKEEVKDQVDRLLEAIPVHYREVITLCWIQGFSYEEAAGIIGCSVEAVSSRLMRAKKYCIKLMRKKEGERK